MALVTFKRSGTAKSIRGSVRPESGGDTRKLNFDQNGVAKMELDPDTYILGCIASGKKDDTFKIAITSPPASRADVHGTLPQSGFDFGAVEFDVI